MRILITGGAGFIGRALTARMVAEGHDVHVLDNLARGTFAVRELAGATCIEADIRDPEACLRASHGTEVIVHLAAVSNVMGAEADPDGAFETNVRGTWNMLEAAGQAGVPHLIFSSSREVYGDAVELPVAESAPLSPLNVYGSSKAAGEMLLRSHAGDPHVSILRLANVIGPGDAGRVVPLWLSAARRREPLRVFGGSQVMDFVPMETVVRAIERVASRPIDGPLNIGSGRPITLLDLANRILAVTQSTSPIAFEPARPAEVTRFCADVNRLRCLLGIDPPADPLEVIAPWWDR